MADSDNEFETGVSSGSNTTFGEAGRMKPGSLLMMKDTFPCKVTGFATAKPGKHGSAKAMITGKDIFTEKQYEETFGTGDQIPVPIVIKTEYTCIDVQDGVLSLMDQTGEMKEDMNLPTESHLKDVANLIKSILEADKKECLVTCQKWGDKEQVVSCREGQETGWARQWDDFRLDPSTKPIIHDNMPKFGLKIALTL